MNNQPEVDQRATTQPIRKARTAAKLAETQPTNIQPEVTELTEFFKDRGASKKLLWQVMQADKNAREVLKITARTLLNVGISIADFIPVAGDSLSLLADAAKFFPKTDLTPNVSKKIALGSEGLELVSGGALPTHAIETILQIKHDVPQIKEGVKRMKIILTAHHNAINSEEVDKAVSIFEGLK